MSAHDDEGRIPVPGRSDENPSGIYKALEDAIRNLDGVIGDAATQAARLVLQIDPTYSRWHELYGDVGEPPNPPRELRLAYDQLKRLLELSRAVNREHRELDERLYGKPVEPPDLHTRTRQSVRIRRVTTNAKGEVGPWWEAQWEYDNGTGGGVQAKDKDHVLAVVAEQPAPDMQIQDPETREWSPWTPETGD